MAKSETVKTRIRYSVTHNGKAYNPGETFNCPIELMGSLRECFDVIIDGKEPDYVEPATIPNTDIDPAIADRFKFWNTKKREEIIDELKTRAIIYPDDANKKELIEILISSESV